MRYFIGCVALLLAFAGCSTTEPVQQEQETEPSEPVASETAIPSWYDSGIHFSSDSLSLHGYALASATDSARAAELSTQTALEYLRVEIDQTAEEARRELIDRSGREENYNSPAFIIHLRNAISGLPLDVAKLDLQHEITDRGVHYSYTKASILRTELPKLFGDKLDDDVFLRKIGVVSQ